MKPKFTYSLIVVLLTLLSCSQGNDKGHQKGQPAADGVRIAWDYSFMQQLAEKGGYPRMRRLQDGSLVVVYDTYSGSSQLIRSLYNGASWSTPVTTFSQFTHTDQTGKSTMVTIANSNIFQLSNGDIILGCNYRPEKDGVAPFSIAIRRSTDNGLSWHVAQLLYHAAPRFKDGCWEPAFLQLPNGELQVYFANEHPYQNSYEQEISLLSSTDNGATWSANARIVSFRAGRRDGMPVPQIFGDEIVVVVEDNKIGAFKPYTVRTTLADNWIPSVMADSPDREYALVEKADEAVYRGAPYLLKIPTGEAIISYYTTENRSQNWELSTMEVAVGDRTASLFDNRSQPFNVPLSEEAKWNLLALWDDNTLVALTSSNFNSALVSPWMIKGHLIPALTIKTKDITSLPLFIGAKGSTQLVAGLGVDNDNLHFNCIVKDSSPYFHPTDNTKSDGVYVYLDIQNAATDVPERGMYKLWCNSRGGVQIWEGDKGSWVFSPSVKVQSSAKVATDGYQLNLEFPKSIATIWNAEAIRIGLALSAYESATSSYVEPLANCAMNASNTWLKINL